ncbi:MAG: bacillithiol biosynthesis cysteine-adding enzyme BshC [Ignavibacteriae bacterium]|nr:bacillithiol biosynthesis cysteine-adding enzyme BshC [Ignavibacteriota bacterium]
MQIPYSKLPGFNEFFNDYISDFNSLKDFFNYNYSDKENIFKSIVDKEENYSGRKLFSRSELADILMIQNKFFNASDAAINNIELLRNDNTFAVVTGQQAGILTGNLYTIVKAVNSYQLARKLSADFPDYNFVPVFWLEADDHDFLEINNINVFDRENKLAKLEYFPNGIPQEKYLAPVNSVNLDDYIEKFKTDLSDTLLKTDFSESVFDFINRSYKPGISFPIAFARFLNYLLGELGIVFCNPADKEIKKLLIPVFEKELNTYPETCERVIETSAVIEQKYEPQVKPQPINVFYNHNGHRHLIEPRPENIFALKNSRQKFEKPQLIEQLYTAPENFSGNVILRPICQDYLLPTIAYVAGPSEIAYFGQFKSVYKFYEVNMPVIYPRVSVTLLENRVSKFLDSNSLTIEELFDEKKITSKFINKINELKVDDIFNNLKDELNALYYSFGIDLEKIDRNLLNTFRNKNEKYIESLDFLREKFLESQIQQNETSINKLKSAIQNVFPDEVLQERFINVVYYINKYSTRILQKIVESMEIDNFNHQVIEISSQ